MTTATEILRNAGYALVAEGDVLSHAIDAMARVRDLGLVDGADEIFHAAIDPVVPIKLAFGSLSGIEPTMEDLAAGSREAVAAGRHFAYLPWTGQLWANAEGRRAIARVLAAARHESFEGDLADEAMARQRDIAEENAMSYRTTAAELASSAAREETRLRQTVADLRTAAAVTLATIAWAA